MFGNTAKCSAGGLPRWGMGWPQAWAAAFEGPGPGRDVSSLSHVEMTPQGGLGARNGRRRAEIRVTDGQLRSHSNWEQVQGNSGGGHRADGPELGGAAGAASPALGRGDKPPSSLP